MSKRTWRTIRTIIILVVLLVITMWIFAYFNGGDWKVKLLGFIKGDGLIWIAGSLLVAVVLMISKRIFKIRF